MDTVNDKWLRLIGIATLWILSIAGNGFHTQPLTGDNLIRILISLLTIAVTWHAIRWLIIYFRRKYLAKSQIGKRLLLTFLAGSLVSTCIIWLMGALRHLALHGTLATYRTDGQTASITFNKMKIALSLYGFDFVQATTTFLFFQVVYETVFFIRDSALNQKRLKQAEQEREKLRTANLQSQLDALKQQVNPHFLFNSLNVLDSLIEDDPRQARVFLEELSTVYRYLLRSNEQNLIALDSELAFIQSYYHLLKTRHGAGLILNVAVDHRYQHCQIPPLTLQLLVENAVKHNVVLPGQPLHIDITTDERNQLQVCNNVQRKTVRVLSNGVGLTNILTKYQMLGQPSPTIQEAEGTFVVTLPLIREN